MEKPNKRIVFTGDAKFTIADSKQPNMIATLKGYALVWNVLSTDRGGYKVRLMPNSAKFAPVVFALYHHDFRDTLGDTASGTLRYSIDNIGVLVEIDLPNTSTGRDVLELVKTGRLRGMSFSMVEGIETGNNTEQDGEKIIDALSYTVDEFTVTPIPSFTQTTIEVKPEAKPEDQPDPATQQLSKENNINREELDALLLKQDKYRLSLYNLE